MLEPEAKSLCPRLIYGTEHFSDASHARCYISYKLLLLFFFKGKKSVRNIRVEKQKRDFFCLWGDMKTIYTSTSVHIGSPLAIVAFITHDFCYCFFRSCYDRTRAEHRIANRDRFFSFFRTFLFFSFLVFFFKLCLLPCFVFVWTGFLFLEPIRDENAS